MTMQLTTLKARNFTGDDITGLEDLDWQQG